MIPFSAALAEEYWEPRLVLPSEQRQVVGQEPLSGRRSEGQPGYLGVWLLHLRRHRAPITATLPRVWLPRLPISRLPVSSLWISGISSLPTTGLLISRLVEGSRLSRSPNKISVCIQIFQFSVGWFFVFAK